MIAELPGITPHVLGFAERVVTLGCTAIVPNLFGTPGYDPTSDGIRGQLRALSVVARVCISRELTTFAAR